MVLIILGGCQLTLTEQALTTMNSKRSTGVESRLAGASSIIEADINVLARLNANYQFPAVMTAGNLVSLWLLNRQTTASFAANNSNPDTLALYDPRSLPRAANLSATYSCLPSEQNCAQISVNPLSISNVGVYSFRFDASNFASTSIVFFNVSAYIEPVQFSCANISSGSSCLYDSTIQTLSVLANSPVLLSCSVQVVQNDVYPIPGQFNFFSDLNSNEECMGPSNVASMNSSMVQATFNGSNGGYNLLMSRLSKNCTRTFSIKDTSYSCLLNPSQSNSTLYKQPGPLETLNIKLDVQYGPDATLPLMPIPTSYAAMFNKTKTVNDNLNTTFVCPFVGNPSPIYFWRVANVVLNGSDPKLVTLTPSSAFSQSTSNTFVILNNLQVGQYTFECKAQVAGIINQVSPTVQFNLNMLGMLNIFMEFF